jgi:probable rRNA maturation factor
MRRPTPRRKDSSADGGRAAPTGRSPAGTPPFDLTITATVGKPHVAYVRRHLRRAHPLVARAPREMSLVIVNDARMSDLHEQFLRIPGPTDVLTFELDHEPGGRVTSGEVVVCLGEARRQARERKTSVERELLLYALHGLLHLSGFDDRTPADFTKMHHKEDQVLQAIGVGAVFTPTGTGNARQKDAPAKRTLAGSGVPAKGARLASAGTKPRLAVRTAGVRRTADRAGAL